MYWINMDAQAVMWTTLDQMSRGTLIQGAVQHRRSAGCLFKQLKRCGTGNLFFVLVGVRTECVAVDWVGRNLYWTGRREGQINAVGLVGFRAEPVIIVDGVDELSSLALLPQKG